MCKKKNEYDYITDQYRSYLNKEKNEERKTYIEERLIEQIKWYDKSANTKQQRYKTLVIISIILTALIPVLSIYTGFEYRLIASTIIAIFSAGATAITTIVNLCEYQKLWINYRNNCEMLKSLLHQYFTAAGRFSKMDEEEKFRLLVDNAELFMTKEHEGWTKLTHEANKEQE